MIIHFFIFPYHCCNKRFSCFSTNVTKLRTDPHVNKDFFLFEFFSRDSLSFSKVGATHV